jgi:hypothetical protein
VVGKTKKPTKKQSEYMDFLKHHIPCMACLTKKKIRHPEIHHLTDGGRRLGHDWVLSLCPYHHRGVNDSNRSTQQMIGQLGHSVAHGRKAFRLDFGGQRKLVEIQKWLADRFHEDPWSYYNIPDLIIIEMIYLWNQTKD